MVVVTLAIVTFAGIAVWREDYRTLLILVAFLLFVAGADLGAMLRAWRGSDEPPAAAPPLPPPDPPAPPSLTKGPPP